MNYATYMRKIAASQPKIIGFQNGQDSDLYTRKVQARAQTIKTPVAVETSFSQIGGTIANIMEPQQQNSAPTSGVCSGYKGVTQGFQTTDATMNILGAAQHCAVCSDTPSSEPTAIVIPCATYVKDGVITSNEFIPPPSNAPGVIQCCTKDPSILFQGNQELVTLQAQQYNLRKQFGLPNKLQGLRGAVIGAR